MPCANDAHSTLTRGRFVFSGLAAGLLGFSGAGPAAGMTDSENANLALVTAFCESFAGRDMTKIASFLAANCVYRVTETSPPLTGPAALERIKTYVERADKIEFKILESWARGLIVVNERVDTFISPARTNALHLTGVFFVRDGKIAEWADYIIR
jgi:limonene-1,2-epoxide hydrolase